MISKNKQRILIQLEKTELEKLDKIATYEKLSRSKLIERLIVNMIRSIENAK